MIYCVSNAEVILFLVRVTCIIFERAVNTDIWQAMVARANKSQKNSSNYSPQFNKLTSVFFMRLSCY